MMTLYEKALLFAARAHDGQKRKGDGAPYIIHPIMVSKILNDQKCSENAVIAGLLHDTVEDTPVSIKDIEREFGSDIGELVSMCTEPEKAMRWEDRKKHSIEKIKTVPLDAKYVTCADKLHNLRSLVAAFEKQGQDVWKKFSRGYGDQKWYAQSMLESLFFGIGEADLKPMLFEYKELVEEFYKN